jgi:hypothetical protein
MTFRPRLIAAPCCVFRASYMAPLGAPTRCRAPDGGGDMGEPTVAGWQASVQNCSHRRSFPPITLRQGELAPQHRTASKPACPASSCEAGNRRKTHQPAMPIAGERPEPAVQRSGQPYVVAVNGDPPPQRGCQSPPNQREAPMQLPRRASAGYKMGHQSPTSAEAVRRRVACDAPLGNDQGRNGFL